MKVEKTKKNKKKKGPHLQATLISCTVNAVITRRTRVTTFLSAAAEFGILARTVVFPARGTIRAAFQPRNHREATSSHNNRQNGP